MRAKQMLPQAPPTPHSRPAAYDATENNPFDCEKRDYFPKRGKERELSLIIPWKGLFENTRDMMHCLPFLDNYKRSNSISTVPMSISNVKVCIFDPPSQLRTDFVGYTSRTAEVGTGPLSPGHGDRGLVANLMSSHRAATLSVRNRIVTSARPRAITCCGGHSTCQR